MFGLIETFLTNQTSKNAIDHERPYKDVDLEVLQEKIEKQEEKKAKATSQIVKKCADKILKQLEEEINIRFS